MSGSGSNGNGEKSSLPMYLPPNNQFERVALSPDNADMVKPASRLTTYIPRAMHTYLTTDLGIPDDALCAVDQAQSIVDYMLSPYYLGWDDTAQVTRRCADELVFGFGDGDYTIGSIAAVRTGDATTAAGAHHGKQDKNGEYNSLFFSFTHEACTNTPRDLVGHGNPIEGDPDELNPDGVTMGVILRDGQLDMTHACGAIGGALKLMRYYNDLPMAETELESMIDKKGIYQVTNDINMCKMFTRLWEHKTEILAAPTHEQMHVAHEYAYKYMEQNIPKILGQFNNVGELSGEMIHLHNYINYKHMQIPRNLLYVRDFRVQLTQKRVDKILADQKKYGSEILTQEMLSNADYDSNTKTYIISLYDEFKEILRRVKETDEINGHPAYTVYDGVLSEQQYKDLIQEEKRRKHRIRDLADVIGPNPKLELRKRAEEAEKIRPQAENEGKQPDENAGA